ncbi:MAG: MFS transporter [Asgard group archaeon]|nr:MFS transporter [Asgard group archaeon]
MVKETPPETAVILGDQPFIKHEMRSDEKPKSTNWFQFERNEIFLLISYFFFGVGFANYEPYAPVWLNQIFNENSFLIIGFVVVIPSLVGALITPVWGILADKFGSKRFVIIGFIAFSAMFFSLIFTFSSTYFLSLVLVGYLLGSSLSANFFVLATKSVNKPKEMILSKLTIVVSLAYVIFSPVAGWIYEKFENSMTIQLIISVVAVFLAMIIVLFVNEKKHIIKEEANKEIPNDKPVTKVKLTPLPWIFVGIMVLTFFFQSGAGFWAYSSVYFLDTLLVKGTYFSIFITVKTALAVPLSLLLGHVKREKIMSLLVTFFAIYYSFVYIIMILFPENWILLIIVNCLPMYPIYNVFLYGFTATYSNAARRATAFGVFSTIGTLGYVVGIITLGAIADWSSTGIFAMFWPSLAFFLITLLVSILMFILVFRKKKDPNPIESK